MAEAPPSAPPLDLVPLKEAARQVDRSPSTLRDWIRAGELRGYAGEGTHPQNRPTLVSVSELQALVVVAGKAAHPGRRPPAEDPAAARVSEVEIRALRAELDAERRVAAATAAALALAEAAAADLRLSLERERARADGAEAEVAALKAEKGLPWWRRLLPGPR